MIIDRLSAGWSRFGLDYSTHSAVALALVFYLFWQWRTKAFHVFLAVTLLASYYALEVYQNYHSLADIVTTVAAILPALLFIYCYFLKQRMPSDTK